MPIRMQKLMVLFLLFRANIQLRLYLQYGKMIENLNDCSIQLNTEARKMDNVFKDQEMTVVSTLSTDLSLSISITPLTSITEMKRTELKRKLEKDHQFFLEICELRYQALVAIYDRMNRKKFNWWDDTHDFLELNKSQSQPEQLHLNQLALQQCRQQHRENCRRTASIYRLSKVYERKYFQWVSEEPSRQQNLYNQFRSTMHQAENVGRLRKAYLVKKSNLLISCILYPYEDIRNVKAEILCRVFFIAGRVLSVDRMRQMVDRTRQILFQKMYSRRWDT